MDYKEFVCEDCGKVFKRKFAKGMICRRCHILRHNPQRVFGSTRQYRERNEQVIALISNGMIPAAVARQFGISRQRVFQIQKGRNAMIEAIGKFFGLGQGEQTQPSLAEETQEERKKKRRPVGVYLRKDTRAAVEQIAEAEGVSRHALLAYAVADFVRRYRKGKVRIETKEQTTLRLEV